MKTSDCLAVAAAVLSCWHPSATAQAAFPVISRTAQQERDADRKLILQTELHEEQGALVKAQAALSNAPDEAKRKAVHRHQENINALRRELGRSQVPVPQMDAAIPQRSSQVPQSRGTRHSPTEWVIFAGDAPSSGPALPPRGAPPRQQPAQARLAPRAPKEAASGTPVQQAETNAPPRDLRNQAPAAEPENEAPFVQLVN